MDYYAPTHPDARALCRLSALVPVAPAYYDHHPWPYSSDAEEIQRYQDWSPEAFESFGLSTASFNALRERLGMRLATLVLVTPLGPRFGAPYCIPGYATVLTVCPSGHNQSQVLRAFFAGLLSKTAEYRPENLRPCHTGTWLDYTVHQHSRDSTETPRITRDTISNAAYERAFGFSKTARLLDKTADSMHDLNNETSPENMYIERQLLAARAVVTCWDLAKKASIQRPLYVVCVGKTVGEVAEQFLRLDRDRLDHVNIIGLPIEDEVSAYLDNQSAAFDGDEIRLEEMERMISELTEIYRACVTKYAGFFTLRTRVGPAV